MKDDVNASASDDVVSTVFDVDWSIFDYIHSGSSTIEYVFSENIHYFNYNYQTQHLLIQFYFLFF